MNEFKQKVQYIAGMVVITMLTITALSTVVGFLGQILAVKVAILLGYL